MAQAPSGAETTRTNAALLPAAGDGRNQDVAAALDAGAGVEARDDRDRTTLLLTAANDHVEVAELLVTRGAEPDAPDAEHDTP